MRKWLRWRLRQALYGREGVNRRARLRAQRLWCTTHNMSLGDHEQQKLLLANQLRERRQ